MSSVLTQIARVAGYASALFLVAMMSITVADVVLRAAFNLPITGAYDLVQLFLVGTVFLSIPDVFLHDENIVIDFVDHFFAAIIIRALRLLAQVAAVIFLAVLSWRMVEPALDAWRFGETSPDLSIPMAVHWALMIAGIVLALATATGTLVASLRGAPSARELR